MKHEEYALPKKHLLISPKNNEIAIRKDSQKYRLYYDMSQNPMYREHNENN